LCLVSFEGWQCIHLQVENKEEWEVPNQSSPLNNDSYSSGSSISNLHATLKVPVVLTQQEPLRDGHKLLFEQEDKGSEHELIGKVLSHCHA
jgi:hypothetical protein